MTELDRERLRALALKANEAIAAENEYKLAPVDGKKFVDLQYIAKKAHQYFTFECDPQTILALLAMVDKLQRKVSKRDDFLAQAGYRRCNIPACNCTSWHSGHASERLREIGDELFPLTQSTTIVEVVKKLVIEHDEKAIPSCDESSVSSSLDEPSGDAAHGNTAGPGAADVYICRRCRHPIGERDSCEHYGDHKTHMTSRCFDLLRAEVESLKSSQSEAERLREALAEVRSGIRDVLSSIKCFPGVPISTIKQELSAVIALFQKGDPKI